MKKILFPVLSLALVSAFLSCNKGVNGKAESDTTVVKQINDSLQELIGKTLKLNYTSGMTAVVTYVSKDKVHWVTYEGGKETGSSDETAIYERLSNNQFLVGWVEKDGFAVSQVLDLGSNKVSAILNSADKKGRGERSSVLSTGTIEDVKQ